MYRFALAAAILLAFAVLSGTRTEPAAASRNVQWCKGSDGYYECRFLYPTTPTIGV